jgi:N-acetylmuramoyl-L-alanine amidase
MPAASTSDRRRVPVRCGLVVLAAVALALSLVTPTVTGYAATAPKGKVVLDPDDDYSHAQWGGATYTELPITYAIAQAAKAKLESLCDTRVVISRDASTAFVDRAQRAALMTSADVSLTISLNNLTGSPWGTATDGG